MRKDLRVGARVETDGTVRGCRGELHEVLEEEAEWTDLVTIWMKGRGGLRTVSEFEE